MKRILSFFYESAIGLFPKVLLAVVLSVLLGALTVLVPYLVGIMLDYLVFDGATLDGLLSLCGIFAIASIAKLATSYAAGMVKAKSEYKISYAVSKRIVKHVHSLPPSFATENCASEMSQKIYTDSAQVINFALSFLCGVATNLLTLVFPFVILVSINAYIALTLFLFSGLYLISYKCMKGVLYKAGLEYRESQTGYFGRLNEQFSLLKFTKDNSLCTSMLQRFDEAFLSYFNSVVSYQRILYLFGSLDNLIAALCQIVLFVLGGISVINGSMSIGEFSIVNSYFGVVVSSIRFFFTLGKDIQVSLVSLDRMQTIEEMPSERYGSTQPADLHSISITSLRCSLEEDNVICYPDYRFQSGHIYAIVGPNGSGKTTLLNIILGECLECSEGQVKYDEAEQKDVDMAYLREKIISNCEQRPVLMADSLEYNLTLGRVGIDETETLVKAMGLDECMALGQEDVSIASSECGLSGGERQKIAIVRALSPRRPVLLLDEPTSALDANSKEKLIQILQEYKRDRIVLVVTHDQDLVQIADKVFDLGR